MSTAVSPARRVLGQKNPNAPFHHQTLKPTKETTSPVLPRNSAKRPAASMNNLLTGPRPGQKRKIEIVNEVELSDSQGTIDALPLSQVTDLLSETLSDSDMPALPSMTQSKSTLNTSLMTSYSSLRDSQEEPAHVESEFQILDEPSQQTLDKMHAVSFTQQTSQLAPSLRPSLTQEASQLSVSMSSLIDFENNRSSQEDDMQMIAEPGEPEHVEEDNNRKEMMLEKAETLRLRLRLAFYKVQTNQIASPFARLQAPKHRTPSPTLAAESSSPKSSSTIRQGDVQASIESAESRVTLARARATAGPHPPVRSLSALPMPQILPTAFSARWNDAAAEQRGNQKHNRSMDLPSSPPESLAEVRQSLESEFCDAPPIDPKTSKPRRLTSPIVSDNELEESEDTVKKHRSQPRSRKLTSSVVKGEAASSLLELLNGARS